MHVLRVFADDAAWLEQGSLQRLVMVVSSIDTQEVLERWTFMVHTSKDAEKQQQQQGCVCLLACGMLVLCCSGSSNARRAACFLLSPFFPY